MIGPAIECIVHVPRLTIAFDFAVKTPYNAVGPGNSPAAASRGELHKYPLSAIHMASCVHGSTPEGTVRRAQARSRLKAVDVSV